MSTRPLDPGQDTLSILIIEDNPMDAELLTERLRGAGFRFEASYATCRAEFEDCVAARKYDLVLADFSLPDFDGHTALAVIRGRDKNLPFIFVSGVLGEEVAVETLHRGATDYVLKQRLERLAPAVTRALNAYAEHLSRVEAESKLHETEQLFEKLTDALPAMVWTTDAEGRLTYSNDAWERYFAGVTADSWCHRETVHLEDLSHTSRLWLDARQSGRPVELECRFRRNADGTYRWHLVRAIPLRSDDPQSPWLGACTDIQAQKQREDALRTSEKLAAVGRMTGVIAHEINNPLESLVNLIYLLRDADTRKEPGKSLLQEIEQQLFRISNITRQTLTFYRDKAVLGDVDCRSLFEDSVVLFGPKLRQKKIDVRIRVDERTHVQGRTGELRQVLVNLLSNAIDALPEGGSLVLEAHPVSRAGGEFVLLRVRDTGPGIPEEIRRQLFQPFFSTKGSLGTGLGLWVSKSIVEAHRGTIDIQSGNGETVASILLPAQYRGDDRDQGYKPDLCA